MPRSLSWSSKSSPLMELLKSSSESIFPEAFVTGVAGRLSIRGGSGDFAAFLRGSSRGLGVICASEAFRLWTVGGVVVILSPFRLMTEPGYRTMRVEGDDKRWKVGTKWRRGRSQGTERVGGPQILVSGLYSHKIQWMVRVLRRVGG